jgi:hypothetical protein
MSVYIPKLQDKNDKPPLKTCRALAYHLQALLLSHPVHIHQDITTIVFEQIVKEVI